MQKVNLKPYLANTNLTLIPKAKVWKVWKKMVPCKKRSLVADVWWCNRSGKKLRC